MIGGDVLGGRRVWRAVLLIRFPVAVQPARCGIVVGCEAQRLPQRVCEFPARPVPLLRGLGHRLGQGFVRSCGQARPPRAQRRRRVGHVRVHHRDFLIALERHRPGQQLVRHARQRVLVGPSVHRAPPDLLRRHIRRGANPAPGGGQPRWRHGPLADPEVRQVHVLRPARPRVHQDVGRLDIPVHQAGGVRGVQRKGHRGDESHGPSRRQRTLPRQHLPQVTTMDEPHRDEQRPAGLAGLVHRDDVRVIHRRCGPRLGDEPAPERLVLGQPGREDLQRYRPVQPLIAGPEHDRHAAPADLRLQPVTG